MITNPLVITGRDVGTMTTYPLAITGRGVGTMILWTLQDEVSGQ
jgi:hypothetical protein